MTGKGIIILILVIAAIPALFMLLVGIFGGLDDKKKNRRVK